MNQNKVMNSKYLFYHQEIDKSPHIKVIIEVVQIHGRTPNLLSIPHGT